MTAFCHYVKRIYFLAVTLTAEFILNAGYENVQYVNTCSLYTYLKGKLCASCTSLCYQLNWNTATLISLNNEAVQLTQPNQCMLFGRALTMSAHILRQESQETVKTKQIWYRTQGICTVLEKYQFLQRDEKEWRTDRFSTVGVLKKTVHYKICGLQTLTHGALLSYLEAYD